MFDALTTRFAQDLATFKHVLDAHDCARANYEQPPGQPDPWAIIRTNNLRRTNWHIYDHCAAFTRLYAIYATFIDDLVDEYLSVLPTLYITYDLLPESISTQHRIGLATMLGRIGEDGKYQQLSERELITTLNHGVTGGTPYKLVTKAFLAERLNYRLEVIGRILSTLGIDDAAKRISQDPDLKQFLATTKLENTTAGSELEQFIRRRNEAAHSQVSDTVGTDEIKSTADFLAHVGNAIANLLAHAIIARQYAVGQLRTLGTVEQLAYGGYVVITHLDGCMIRVGDRFALGYKGNVLLATVTELRQDNVAKQELLLTAPTEVGMHFDHRIKKGATICALRDRQTAPLQVLRAFEERNDDVTTAITDQFRTLLLRTDDGSEATLEGVEEIEVDVPELPAISDTHADLAFTATLTFTAILAGQNASDDENGQRRIEQVALEDITSTISVNVGCRLTFPNLAALTNPKAATIAITHVNHNMPVLIPTKT